MMKRLIPIAAVAVLMLSSCQETPSDTAKDVAKAQEEAGKKVDAARQDADKTVAKASDQVADAKADYAKTDADAHKVLSKVESEAMVKTAQADFDVAVAEAEGRNKVAKEKCDALSRCRQGCLPEHGGGSPYVRQGGRDRKPRRDPGGSGAPRVRPKGICTTIVLFTALVVQAPIPAVPSPVCLVSTLTYRQAPARRRCWASSHSRHNRPRPREAEDRRGRPGA
jgi:hypothetical protein